MEIRYVITGVNPEGLRQMAQSNNCHNTYPTREKAEDHLRMVRAHNDEEKITWLMGTDLKVFPVECYDHGDSSRTVFGDDYEETHKYLFNA